MSGQIIREFRWRAKDTIVFGVYSIFLGIFVGGEFLLFYFIGTAPFVPPFVWIAIAILCFLIAVYGAFSLLCSKPFYICLSEDEIIMSGHGFFKKYRQTIRWDSIETVDKFSEHYTRLVLKDGTKAGIWYHGLHYTEKDALRKILSEKLGAPLPPGLS